jgi:hypothetical protein
MPSSYLVSDIHSKGLESSRKKLRMGRKEREEFRRVGKKINGQKFKKLKLV